MKKVFIDTILDLFEKLNLEVLITWNKKDFKNKTADFNSKRVLKKVFKNEVVE